jgi:hypothetical protein
MRENFIIAGDAVVSGSIIGLFAKMMELYNEIMPIAPLF